MRCRHCKTGRGPILCSDWERVSRDAHNCNRELVGLELDVTLFQDPGSGNSSDILRYFVEKVADFPDTQFLNGLGVLSNENRLLYAADPSAELLNSSAFIAATTMLLSTIPTQSRASRLPLRLV